MNAAIFVKAVALAGKDLTRQLFRDAMNTKMADYDLGGIRIHFNEDSHQALKSIYLAHVKQGGALEPVK